MINKYLNIVNDDRNVDTNEALNISSMFTNFKNKINLLSKSDLLKLFKKPT